MANIRSFIVGAVMSGCLIGCFAGVAYAQAKPNDSPIAVEQAEKKKAAAAIDRQYKSTLKRFEKDAPEARPDPWQNMRGSDTPKAKH